MNYKLKVNKLDLMNSKSCKKRMYKEKEKST